MRVETAKIVVATNGKGTYEITDQLASAVTASGVQTGAVTVFVRHTSCSLIVMENAFGRHYPAPSPGWDKTGWAGPELRLRLFERWSVTLLGLFMLHTLRRLEDQPLRITMKRLAAKDPVRLQVWSDRRRSLLSQPMA